MTRLWPCIAVAVVCSLLVFTTSAHAECAWVLWQELTISSKGSMGSSWELIEAMQSRDACVPRAAAQTKARADYMKVSNSDAPRPDPDQIVEIIADSVRVTMARAGQFWVYRFVCLPDTIDPRGPKGK